ncbi:Rhamnolipids biosynthesis 3-oxoacyl-[acyl-carrier-protein] reductase [compost metagenome]
MGWKINDLPRQDERNALVTGGASGIGFQVAQALGKKGAHVTIVGRDAAKGAQAVAQLRAAGGDYAFEQMDLASQASIAEFASRWGERPLHLLMNVAGVMAVPERSLTADGYEMHMGTNFLGHFALTGRLLPVLKAASARVVTVSALVGRFKMAELDPDDLQAERQAYTPMAAYARSKLADIMFAAELQARASAANSGVTSVSVDPGTANTSLQRYTSGAAAVVGKGLINLIGYPLERVAENVLFAAAMEQPTEQMLIVPSFFIQRLASPHDAGLPPLARQQAMRVRLWEKAESLTGVRFHI